MKENLKLTDRLIEIDGVLFKAVPVYCAKCDSKHPLMMLALEPQEEAPTSPIGFVDEH